MVQSHSVKDLFLTTESTEGRIIPIRPLRCYLSSTTFIATKWYWASWFTLPTAADL